MMYSAAIKAARTPSETMTGTTTLRFTPDEAPLLSESKADRLVALCEEELTLELLLKVKLSVLSVVSVGRVGSREKVDEVVMRAGGGVVGTTSDVVSTGSADVVMMTRLGVVVGRTLGKVESTVGEKIND